MFLISSEFWPKLAHHHRHSGLTSFWVTRSKCPVMRLLECVMLPSLCSGTYAARRGTVANQMSRSCCYIARRRNSCFFLWGIRFTFYTATCCSRNRRTSQPVGQQSCLYPQVIGFESVARYQVSYDLILFAAWCLYRDADKSLARPGRKHARKHNRDARDFNKIETRTVIKFLFLQDKAPKEIHTILTDTLACFLPGRSKNLSAHLYTIFFFRVFVIGST